ncbi:hypothetical protein ABIH81_04865 [Micromonospora sp. HUAS YX12]|uniref:BtrH N-terminal domain-containing protein n=1 Tax=Micromonospora sp. HUAS YX12 TaxID=3156396 RepID=A0AAU7R2U8_9ACTN
MGDDTAIYLPVGDPLAFGYQFYAFPLAIQAADSRTADWVLSNFIQVEFDRRGQECDVPFSFYLYDYAISPWLEVVRGTRRWYSSSTMCDVIREGLTKGYYAYTIVDEYHIPNRESSGIEHFPHDILVHGFDHSTDSFTVLGFDQRMHFRSTSVGGAEFAKAYARLDGPDMENAPVLFYRLRNQPDFGYQPITYELNLELIRRTIDEYLRSWDTSRHFEALRRPRDCAYGLECYTLLENYLRSYATGQNPYDIRHLHVLWEHKRLMTARVRRIGEVSRPLPDLEAAAERIESMSFALRNAMIRNHIRGERQDFLDNAVGMLDRIRSAEEAMLRTLLARLPDGGPAPERARARIGGR